MSSVHRVKEAHIFPQDKDWIIHISRSLEEELESNNDEINVPVSIFNVPKTLISYKPDAYVPQMVALGPYHHDRLELFEMERYKVMSAKRAQKKLHNVKFHDLVNQFIEQEGDIRACYHRFLDFDRETLSWMFAIDAAFLLAFLQPYATRKEGPSLDRVSSMMAHLIDYTRRKSSHDAVLRDIIMLENQIPLFLLREVNKFYKHEKDPDEELVRMLMGFCKDLSPLTIRDSQHIREECFKKSHLLELLYVMVTPHIIPSRTEIEEIDQKIKRANHEQEQTGCFLRKLKSILGFIYFINSAIISFLGRICKSKMFAVFFKLIKRIGHLNTTGAIQQLMESTEGVTEAAEDASNSTKTQTSLMEEIAIPSVTELSNIGVKFCLPKGGLDTIKFDIYSGKFYLPIIDLDHNSEVVLRNLVAYEASIAPEEMFFTRYIELMNGLIDTKEDVTCLREAGIILNRLKSDEEVANLWNGMTMSVRMTKIPVLDKVIEDVNKYYSSLWKVKVKMTMKKYVFSSWPALTFFGANILILFSAVEAFCSIYNCSNWLSRL